MNETMTVIPGIGCYLVSSERPPMTSEQVSKDKRCTCGGTRTSPCRHIEAVAAYLRKGGQRAGSASQEGICPICGATVQNRSNGMWRCSADVSHYWLWRGEQNGGAIRRFLTQPHPNKEGAFYEMTIEQRKTFLEEVGRRMHVGGYTPYVREVNEMYQDRGLSDKELLVGLSADLDECAICKAPIPADGPPLCPVCDKR